MIGKGLFAGTRGQRALQAVAPAVVGTGQPRFALAAAVQQPRAPVAAYIEVGAQHTGLVAQHQHRVWPHVQGDEVARLR